MKQLVGGLLFLVAAGCASPARVDPADQISPAPAASKTIIVSGTAPVKAFGAWDTGAAGGTFPLHEIHTSPLFTTDKAGNAEPRLLSQLPSLDDGSMRLLPDGRMQTTWTVRPGVSWHDGAPFTAHDISFTFRVYRDRDVGLQLSAQLDNVQSIEAIDDSSAVVTWKTTYYDPFHFALRQFWSLPSHLLAPSFEGDKGTFRNLAYWTNEYVNTGAFRLMDYGLGEELVFARFDDYFLGGPRVDKVVMRIIRDPNVLFANIQAGAVDMAAHGALTADGGLELDRDWKQNGGGRVVFAPGALRFEEIQFDPQLARPTEIRDIRTRGGLLRALDRDALREALLPGVSNTAASSYLPDSDPRVAWIGQPLNRYAYDPKVAAQQVETVGWQRASDGRLLNASGELVAIDLVAQEPYFKEGAIIAQYWRVLGAQVNEVDIQAALVADKEYIATLPAFRGNANSAREGFFARLLSTADATPQNRYSGSNTQHYMNPRLDQVFASLAGTPDEVGQRPLFQELSDILTNDLPVLPLYSSSATPRSAKECVLWTTIWATISGRCRATPICGIATSYHDLVMIRFARLRPPRGCPKVPEQSSSNP
ncbi:MAG TPA: ABC transporter substrate-binding protein [Chloroflexota bacterium]